MKLFREWSAKWPADLKQMLRDKCQQIDVEWSDRFASELAGELAQVVVNAANGHAGGAAAGGAVDGLALAAAAGIENGVNGGDDVVDVDDRYNGVADVRQSDDDDDDVGVPAVVQQQLSTAMNLQNGPVVSA